MKGEKANITFSKVINAERTMKNFKNELKVKLDTIVTKKKGLQGLTLVEILVVILIIGILIVALVPRISAATDKARETQVKTDMRTFSLAAESVMREYAGFTGVPLMAKDGSVISTIGEESWAKSVDLVDADKTPMTESLIKAVNRYLESSYQFGANVTTDEAGVTLDAAGQLNFGRSNAKDPWGQPYEIFFVARSKDAATNEALSSDRIYVTSSGKTKDEYFADYTLLVQYKKGEVRTATVGFDGETYTADTDYVTGTHNDNFYVAVQDLFYANHGGVADTYFDIQDTTPVSLFRQDAGKGLGGTTQNTSRLFIAVQNAAGDEAGTATKLPAINGVADRASITP